MTLLNRITKSNFFIRLNSWEYWPFGIVQFPVLLYWLWLSIRARSLLFFSASNPTILLGGMFGESKYDILKNVPAELIPRTVLVKRNSNAESVVSILHQNNYQFPVIFKPDIGERGFMVQQIFSEDDIRDYLGKIKGDFLIQELIDLPIECGVFYTRFPDDEKGRVTSIVVKEMLHVIGDGQSTVQELILNSDRAKLQWERLRVMHHDRLDEVIPKDHALELNQIGNHCLGTKFMDGNYLINVDLSNAFDRISKQVGEFYFGRFDLKCSSFEALERGDVKIMEVNGCGAEPAHIYQPGFPLLKAVGVLLDHWRNMFLISEQNRKRGASYTSFMEGVRIYKNFKTAMM